MSDKQNVPSLRFPGFEGEWERKKIGKITTFKRGFDLPQAERKAGNIPIISSGGVSGFHDEYKVEGPGIVTGRYGSIGDLFYIEENFWPLNTSLWVEDFHGNDKKFSYYQLSKVNFKILSDKTGVPGVNRNDLHQLKAAVPTFPEQKKIAAFLSAVDNKLSALRRKHELLQTYKRGVMQKIFSRELRFKADDGGVFPEWEEKKLGEVIKHCSSGATPYRGTPEYYEGAIKWISSGELNYNVIYDTKEHISEEALKNTSLKLHPPGTFLMAITGLEAAGTRGACGITGDFATTNQSCMALYPTKHLDNDYLYQWYRYYGQQLAFKYCQGTKQQSYTAGLIKIIPISLPQSVKEQQRIATFLTALDRKIEAVAAQIEKMEAFKKGLLQQMFV